MKANLTKVGCCLALFLLAVTPPAGAGQSATPLVGVNGPAAAVQADVGMGFTYQGSLWDVGSPANGLYDFEFRLYEDAGCTSQVGATLPVNALLLSDGLFTVPLDFGAVYDGGERWPNDGADHPADLAMIQSEGYEVAQVTAWAFGP